MSVNGKIVKGSKVTGKESWIFVYLIDPPAQVIGELAGNLILVPITVGAFYAGRFVFLFIGNYWPRWAALSLGWVIGIYASLVLYWSMHWMAFAMLHQLDR